VRISFSASSFLDRSRRSASDRAFSASRRDRADASRAERDARDLARAEDWSLRNRDAAISKSIVPMFFGSCSVFLGSLFFGFFWREAHWIFQQRENY
jgi:hypothetical protein